MQFEFVVRQPCVGAAGPAALPILTYYRTACGMYTTDRTTHRTQSTESCLTYSACVCTRRATGDATRRAPTRESRARARRAAPRPGRRRRRCRPVRAPDAVAESETVDRPTHVQTRGLADWRTTAKYHPPKPRRRGARSPRVSRGLAYNYTRTRFCRYPANITKATCRGLEDDSYRGRIDPIPVQML